MSRNLNIVAQRAAVISRTALALAAVASLSAGTLRAQAALGTPFIGANNLSYQTAELTRNGGAELTRVHGVSYAHRFGAAGQAAKISLMVRGSFRPYGDTDEGVADLGGAVAMSYDVGAVPGLSVAASVGAGVMAWNNDVSKAGRAQLTVPLTAGVSYDLHLGRATLSPFATAAVARSDLRTSLDDVELSRSTEWDGRYTNGVAFRMNNVVLTSTRIVGEKGMPNSSRWAFSAGISY